MTPRLLTIIFSFISIYTFAQNSKKTYEVVFKHSFDKDEEGWLRVAEDYFSAQQNPNGYMLTNKTDERHVVAKVVDGFEPTDDFRLSADIWHTEGVNNKGFGLIWFDGTSEYNFLISDNGYFYIGIRHPETGNWSTYNNWEQSTSLQTENGSNIIEVEKQGKTVKFIVNGSIVTSLTIPENRTFVPTEIVGLSVHGAQEVIVQGVTLSKLITLPHPSYIEAIKEGHRGPVKMTQFRGNELVFATEQKEVIDFDLTKKSIIANRKIDAFEKFDIRAYALSPDGTTEALASDYSAVTIIRDKKSGNTLFTVTGKEEEASALAFSNDGKRVAIGGYNKDIRIFSVPDGKELKSLKVPSDMVGSIIFSPNDTHIIASVFDNKIRVWDATTYKPAYELTASGPVAKLAITPDGKFLASSCSNNQTIVWDLNSKTAISTIPLGDNGFGVGISPSGDKVITSAGDSKTNICDVKTGKILHQFESGLYGPAAISGDGKYFAFNGKLGLMLGELKTGKIIKDFGYKYAIVRKPKVVTDFFAHAADVMDIEVIEDGKSFVSVSKDKTIRVWDAATGENIKTFRGQTGEGNDGMLYRVAVSPDKTHVLVGGLLAKEGAKGVGDFRSFNLNTGKVDGLIKRHNASILDLGYSLDGSRFASADFKFLRIWDVKALGKDLNGEEVRAKEIRARAISFEDEISSISLSPDGKKLAMSSITNKDLYLADITSFDDKGNPASFKWIPKHEKNIYAVKFLPDGSILSAGPDNAVLWSADGVPVKEFKSLTVPLNATISFSSDGKLALVGSQVLDIAAGTVIAKAPHEGGSIASCFVGQDLVATAKDNVIYLWNPRTGKEVKQLAPQSELVRRIAFIGNELKIALSPAPGVTVGPEQLRADQITSVFDFSNLKYQKYTGKDVANNNLVNTKDGVKLSFTEQGGTTNLSVISFGSVSINADGAKGASRAFTITPDGNALVGFMNALSLFDKSGKELKRFEGHNGWILALAISADGKYFASYAEDNTLRLWNFDDQGKTENGIAVVQPRATLAASKSGEWICFTPENYYASSKHGGKYVNFLFNNGRGSAATRYAFDQFDLKFNRPDKVLEKIGKADQKYEQAYLKAYEKRLSRYGFSEVDPFNFDLPKLNLITASKQTDLLDETIEFTATGVNPITSIHIYANGVPIYGTAGLALDTASVSVKKKLPVKLLGGKNVLQVSVMDVLGNESLKETITVTSTAAPSKGDLYLVAIGISNYADASYNLTYAAKDANDLSSLYEGKKANFNNVNLISITDQQATRENILKAKETLLKSKAEDEVIIFLAGHGLLDDQLDYYFATHDLDFAAPAGRGLKYEELESLLDGIAARKKLMLIDACHSGEVDKDETALITSSVKTPNVKARGFKGANTKSTGLENSFDLMQAMFADLRKGTGAVVISSAAGVEFAYESAEWKNGVFTFSLLEALKNAPKSDKNKNTKIEVSELKDYVTGRVVELTNGKQHPTSRKENLEFDFNVW